ncbi:heterokaryon incompatibility protein-domain-containing protein [Paraphoma chrysanthemicola]|uniref:Heterokaryon incompatibility protein-domain-containing protein n=1 Tax=Paraphoma chrysanthemicola TaxID=798071 RepID=A0A8K0REQ9_9PLEO|nr:heterokaryon incompatibility protein-domain-containing protein [Paraphoma chrysanthemicola]
MDEAFSYSTDPWVPAKSTDDIRIRLVELQPSHGQDLTAPLHSRIFWTSLSASPAFEALSYVWGSDPPSRAIYIDGEVASITPSLEVALQHIRHESQPVTIWVDQLCINQKDDEEKTEQVQEMARIYRAAAEVIIWLGAAADSSDRVMEVLGLLGTKLVKYGFPQYLTREGSAEFSRIIFSPSSSENVKLIEWCALLVEFADVIDQEFIRSLIAWEKRPWFTRVWVLQEFAVSAAARIRCGTKTISAEAAILARLVLPTVAKISSERVQEVFLELGNDPMHIFHTTRHSFDGRDATLPNGIPLWMLLKSLCSTDMQATQPCDFLYSILSLVNDADTLKLKPDYTIMNDVSLVYARMTRAIIASGEGEILTMVQYPKTRPDLPSWVPDLTSKQRPSFIDQPLDKSLMFFSANRNTEVALLDSSDELILGTTGYVVDVVEDVADEWRGNDTFHESPSVVLQVERDGVTVLGWDEACNTAEQVEITWAPYSPTGFLKYLASITLFCQRSADKDMPIYATPLRRREGLWRIPTADLEKSSDETSMVRAGRTWAKAYELCKRSLDFLETWRSLSREELRAGGADWANAARTSLPRLYRKSMRQLVPKRPFLTEMGYVGLGPPCMEPGDMVILMGFAKLPYMVRAVDEGIRRYVLLGECYCDGIMDGEIVAAGTKRKEEFFFV